MIDAVAMGFRLELVGRFILVIFCRIAWSLSFVFYSGVDDEVYLCICFLSDMLHYVYILRPTGPMWLVCHFMCFTLIRNGLRRIMLLTMGMEIPSKVYLISISLDGIAL